MATSVPVLTAIMMMTAATPMIMPNMVSMDRNLLDASDLEATLITSINFMVFTFYHFCCQLQLIHHVSQ